jgi:membrane-associated phospholipid phosphatase
MNKKIGLLIIFHLSLLRAEPVLTTAGDVLQIALPVMSYSFALRDPDPTAHWEMAYSFFATELLTYGLKETVNETSWGERPNGHRYAFPSGHTSMAFQAAFFVNRHYGTLQAMPFFTLAGLTAYSRIQGRYHSWRDVLGGIAVAYVVDRVIRFPHLLDLCR